MSVRSSEGSVILISKVTTVIKYEVVIKTILLPIYLVLVPLKTLITFNYLNYTVIKSDYGN